MNVAADTRISVYLGSTYYNDQVEGLCGNYNGLSSDDLGAETSMGETLAEQAAPWKTIPACPEAELPPPTDYCEVRFSETLVVNETLFH